ncbi:MAG: ROK family protein [Verrucomicrobia bacterium]|nr:ROK family protein [Verrucomicrobiota bacterium]
MPDNDKSHIVGVDLGGTKILAGVFTPQLKCLGSQKMTTKAERGADAVIERIERCVRDAVDECDLSLKNIRGLGIGSPGSVDAESGKVIFAGNLGWKDVPLRKELEKRLDVPVFVGNDCKNCMLGVHEVEFGGKPRDMVGIFLGTGIGGGLVFDGKLYTGHNGVAGELGHMVIDAGGPKCTCGNRGCFEALASRTAIFRRIKDAVKEGEKTVLVDMLGPDLADMRSGDLRKALKRGDKLVGKIIEDAAHYTGVAVANLVNILNPELVVIGGGVVEQLADEMMPVIEKTAKDGAFPGATRDLEIRASKLGDDAGITGGAVLVTQRQK